MKFCYELHGIGWAAINIEINKKQYGGWSSYLTEPLHDLVYGLLSLLKGCIPANELMHQVTFKLNHEPAIDKFELTCVKENILRLKIEEFKDEPNIHGKIIFEEQCDINAFASQLIDAMDNILREYGLIGYKETWCKEEVPIAG